MDHRAADRAALGPRRPGEPSQPTEERRHQDPALGPHTTSTARCECSAAARKPLSTGHPGLGHGPEIQHFVELESGDAAICWSTPDAPLVSFQDINRGTWPTEYAAANGHLYAYVMNNGKIEIEGEAKQVRALASVSKAYLGL